MEIQLNPVATVKNSRMSPTDDFWGEVISEIELTDQIPTEALDAINGTPVLDIKPAFKEYQPKSDLIQPFRVSDLMKKYWGNQNSL